MIDKDVVVLSIEEQKCDHIANNDVECIVDSATPYHIIPMKGLFTTYKVGDVGTVKMGNSSYLKIVGIGDVCIETNVGSTMMLKDVRHVPDLRMNVFSTLAMDQAGYCNYLGKGRWKLTKGPLVVSKGHACCSLYRTHVKTCKKKFNEIKIFEKTPKMSVGINGVKTKRVKFSLPNSALEEKVVGDKNMKMLRLHGMTMKWNILKVLSGGSNILH